MTEVALAILARDEAGFFLVAEEEGTDNIANNANAFGALEALSRADEAVGVAHDFVEANPDTLLVMAADSDAGGLQVYSGDAAPARGHVAATTDDGGLLDGVQGKFGDVFLSAPDAEGARHPFGIAWTCDDDVAGGIPVRAAGLDAEMVRPLMDNTELDKLMHATLFGSDLF